MIAQLACRHGNRGEYADARLYGRACVNAFMYEGCVPRCTTRVYWPRSIRTHNRIRRRLHTVGAVLGYLFDMSRREWFRLFAYVSTSSYIFIKRVRRYIYIYKSSHNIITPFSCVFFPFLKPRYSITSDLEYPKLINDCYSR